MNTLQKIAEQDETPDAKNVLQDLFQENTGRHMLDSGGAYGRNFEKNQEMDDLEKEKTPLTFDVREYGDNGEIEIIPSVSMFHFMLENADYNQTAHNATKIFKQFADRGDENRSWLSEMTAFIEQHDTNNRDAHAVNTYNHEFCHTDQAVQFIPFTVHHADPDHPEETQLEYDLHGEYALLQVHGGCDIRGGYTVPIVLHMGVHGAAMITRVGSHVDITHEKEGHLLSMTEHEIGIRDIDQHDHIAYDPDRDALTHAETGETLTARCGGFTAPLH